MILEMKVPSPGESITEVEIAEWLVQDGDYVEKDQAIAEVDSDKATLELPAEAGGIIKLEDSDGNRYEEGDAVVVGAVVCLIDTSAAKPEGNFNEAPKEEKKEASKTYEHPGAEIVFRGSDWTVARISDQGQLGKDAAQFYGGSYQEPSRGETRWCTSSPGLSYFNGYIKDGPLYVVIPNSGRKFSGEKEFGDVSGLPALRYQFHFPSNQYMDPQDRQINLVDFLNGQEEGLKEFFKPEFAKGLVNKGGKKVEINYPDSSAGKFVALYGFDELFASLPEDIEHLLINNKSKEDIALNVPESLGRFKSLQALLFQNIIKTLPNSIGELQNLNFLALPSNKELQAIPESVANIPGLAFINLKDSNSNVNIPPRVFAPGF